MLRLMSVTPLAMMGLHLATAIAAPALVARAAIASRTAAPDAQVTALYEAEWAWRGRAYYEAKIREFTTLDLAPEQIHAIGVTEVARIDIDMHETMKKSGWKGDFAAFLTFLKTDPQFYAKTPYELIARATYIANKINTQLKYTLGLLPRFRFTIRPTPAAVAPFGTGGNGGLESCVMNTYNLPARPFYTLPSLVLHECSPGHSLQAALALEGPNRPDLRKNTYFSVAK